MATGIVAILSVQEILETMQQKRQSIQAVYSLRNSTGLAFFKGEQAMVLADSALLQNQNNYTFNMQPHLWQHGVQEPRFVSLEQSTQEAIPFQKLPDGNQLMVANGRRWLILSGPLRVQPLGNFAVDYVLLRRNARVKPEELEAYTFDKVILDGSNSSWYRERMRKELSAAGLTFHDVMEHGAFVVGESAEF